MSMGKKEATDIWLREYRIGDEQGIIDCIRDEYGNTYAKLQWYNKTAIRENALTGRDIFIVAQLPNGEIAATTALTKTRGQSAAVYEIAAQVVKKKYRGHGIAQRIFEYGLKLLENKKVSAVYSQPVLFHDITQRLLCGLGFSAVGILPNVFDLEVLHHSYDNGRNIKMPLGIQVMARYGQDAGRLYLPDRHKAFCRERYEELGAAFEIMDSAVENFAGMPADSRLSYYYDRKHKYLEIGILEIGMNFDRQLGRLLRIYPLKDKNTANVFLNSNDRYAAGAYERLCENGFFFTGIKPLCGNREYIIMHHAGEIPFYFEDLKLDMEFQKIANYIREENMI